MRCVLIACLSAACGSGTGLAIEAQCNPLGDAHCMAPWPSSVFEIDDPTTATGRRLAIPDGTLPAIGEQTIDPTAWNRADGFSPSAPIIVAFKTAVSPHGLPPLDNMDLSLAADSATVILDMTTGERVAHFAVVDPLAANALVLQPAKRLAYGHRYAVAITNRVTASDGEPLEVPTGFAAVRAGALTDHHLLEAARPRLDETLDALDEIDIEDTELVVAWDFTVMSEPQELAALRDRVLETSSFDLAVEHSVRRRDGSRLITGSIAAPLIAGGVHRVAWRALVPACGARPGIALYGHTPLGDAHEIDGQGALATAACRALVGTDLGGLSSHDAPALVRMLGELDDDTVIAALAQGILDQVALVQALRGEAAATSLARLVDTSDMIYIGASQHTGVLALAPVSRGILSGTDATTSRVLDRYRSLLAFSYPQPLDPTLVTGLMQMRWDAFELAPHKPVLLAGSADPQTSWHARSLDLPLLTPAPFTPWGLQAVAIPDTGVGILHEITGYAPCCAYPPCASTTLACSALRRSP